MSDSQTIIIHCTATPPSMDVGFEWIDELHKSFGWSGCGYHWIVKRDGTIERGRPMSQKGAHTKGHNDACGVVLSGGVDEHGKPDCNFTWEQWRSLENLVDELKSTYGFKFVRGHRHYANKACPTFDAEAWAEGI